MALNDKQLCASKFDVVANILPTVFCLNSDQGKTLKDIGAWTADESEIQGSVFVNPRFCTYVFWMQMDYVVGEVPVQVRSPEGGHARGCSETSGEHTSTGTNKNLP